MEEINIQACGLELSEVMQKNILQQIHSVFGVEKYKIHRIFITLFDEKGLEGEIEKGCQIQVKVRGLPTIKTELKSLDILTAVSLAIERAHIKLSHNITDERIKQQRDQIIFINS